MDQFKGIFGFTLAELLFFFAADLFSGRAAKIVFQPFNPVLVNKTVQIFIGTVSVVIFFQISLEKGQQFFFAEIIGR